MPHPAEPAWDVPLGNHATRPAWQWLAASRYRTVATDCPKKCGMTHDGGGGDAGSGGGGGGGGGGAGHWIDPEFAVTLSVYGVGTAPPFPSPAASPLTIR